MPAPSFLVQRQIETAVRVALSRHTGDRDLERLVAEALVDWAERAWPGRPVAPGPGPSPVFLYDDQRRTAEAALWSARLHGIPSVPAALLAYARRRDAAAHAPSVGELLSLCAAEPAAPAVLFCSRADRQRFLARFGAVSLPTVTTADLAAHFRSAQPDVARRRARRLRAFFGWAVRRGYAMENPVAALAVSRPPARLFAFSPRQVRSILRKTWATDQIGFWVLAFFAGLRTGEIQRINRHPSPWSLISFRTRRFTVPSSAGTARVFRLNPTLAAWLRWMRARRVPFFPANFWEKKFPQTWRTALRRHPDNRSAGSPPTIPANIAGAPRATYIVYRIALRDTTVEELSCDLGDRIRRIRFHHNPAVPRRRARAFFDLTPQRLAP